MDKWLHLLWIIPLVFILVYVCYRVIINIIRSNSVSASSDSKNNKKVEGYEGSTTSTPLTVLYFYATWCGHCKSFKPIYEKLVSQQAVSFPLTTFKSYDVDDAANADIVAQYGVNSLPDIRFVTATGDSKYGQNSTEERTLVSLTTNIHAAEQKAQKDAKSA